MPTVMAQAVIRIGRRRSCAPAWRPRGPCRPSMVVMNVTSITEFDTETPMHMIDPMNDSMLSVVPCQQQESTTPQSTPGTATPRPGQARRLEVRGQEHQITATAKTRPMPSAGTSRSWAGTGHRLDADAVGGLASGDDGLRDLPGGAAQILPLYVGDDADVALRRRGRSRRAWSPWHLGHVADHQVDQGIDLAIGTFSTPPAVSMYIGGTSTGPDNRSRSSCRPSS